MTGEMPEAGLCKLMKVGQVSEFVSYHELVKKLFDMLIDEEADLSDKKKRITALICENPVLNGWVVYHARFFRTPASRGRLCTGLRQIDGMIDRDLEKAINRRKGKHNVVRRDD